MPKYFCDYCDTYLTHDSPSVRKTHCAGRKHKENVKAYYQNWLEQEAKNLIDITTAAFKNGTLVSQPPLMAQPQLQIMPQSPTPLLSTTPQPMQLHPLQTHLHQLQPSPQQFQLQPQQHPSPHLQTHIGLNHHHQLLQGQHHQLQAHTSLAAPPSIQQTLQQSTSLPSLQLAAAGTVGGQLVVSQQRPPPATTPQHLAAAQSAFLQHQHQNQHNLHQQQPQDISINVPPAAVTAAAMHLPNGSVAMAGPHHPHHPQHHPQHHPHPHHPQQLPLPPPHGFNSQPLLNPFIHSPFRPPMGLLIFRPQM